MPEKSIIIYLKIVYSKLLFLDLLCKKYLSYYFMHLFELISQTWTTKKTKSKPMIQICINLVLFWWKKRLTSNILPWIKFRSKASWSQDTPSLKIELLESICCWAAWITSLNLFCSSPSFCIIRWICWIRSRLSSIPFLRLRISSIICFNILLSSKTASIL